ncbi:hypothetical protein RINTHM_12660 [Richelia intracellularis HM01]|uniref:hypothetical protein n=1 Tax=Richelia intracellularis TaxID=1164990 RepID=UPI0002B5C568|nr:hypothetical protein [Richelia intracellularis]CCH65726.1 hypothetical protein RINTHM_12660 [Richelia intracellularis HM01]
MLKKTYEYPLALGAGTFAKQIPLEQLNPPSINLSNLSDLGTTLELLQQAGVL